MSSAGSWRGRRTPTLLVLLLALGALAAAWSTDRQAPPIYDGLPLGSPPYRYLDPGPGVAATPPPTSAVKTFTIAGTPYGFELTTLEPDPQAAVLVPRSALRLPAGLATLTLALAPVPPPAAAPAGTTMDGNCYRVSLTGGGSPLSLAAGGRVRVTLRHTGLPGRPTLAVYTGSTWRTVHSVEDAVGSSTADVPQLGDVVLLVSTRSTGGLSRPLTLALIVAGVFLLLAAGLLLLGRGRRRSAR